MSSDTARSVRAQDLGRRLGAGRPGDLRLLAEAVELFAPLGWATHSRWHWNGTRRVVRLAQQGASDNDLDEAITESWNDENQLWLRHAATPMRAWANDSYPIKQTIWDRVGLIDKAIAHHEAGAYEASILIVHAQLDGLTRDLTGRSFYMKSTAGDPYIDDTTLAGAESNLPVVRRVFSEDVKETQDRASASRHGAMHGRDLGYATRINSTKALVLVGALAEYLPGLADGYARQHRVEHDASVAGEGGFDDHGRLVDDRELAQVHRFAWDVDAAYGEAVLMHQPFDLAGSTASKAHGRGLDHGRLRTSEDETGIWWVYELPSGYHLAFCARPTTSPKRRAPDAWRWEAASYPTEPAWRRARGWRSDDDFPRSANWEPAVIV